MTMRLAGALALVLGVAALASASAYAGNGNGNGNGDGNGKHDTAAAAAATEVESSGHGNSANAPGQEKKDEEVKKGDALAVSVPAVSESSVGQDAGPSTGVKPSNDTAHDTHAAASSDQTKQYGNGKTAGQIAIGNGAAPSTVLHGPGNSQPHKVSACSGGHEVDVHALKGKRGGSCGTQPSPPPSPAPTPTPRPNPTPDPGKPGDPGHGPNKSDSPPAATPSSPAADPSKPVTVKPVVSTHRGRVEAASGVLSATGAIGSGALPFTGFPVWIIAVIALMLIAAGVVLRRKSRTPSA